MLHALYCCGISIAYSSVSNLLIWLADRLIEALITAAAGRHMFGYDNINLSTSKYVEQRGARTPAKVTSGTFGIIYLLPGVDDRDMLLKPICDTFLKLEPNALSFEHNIRPSADLTETVNTAFLA